MMVPIMLAGFNAEGVNNFMRVFMDNTGFGIIFVFAILIIAFTYFYTAITINPTQIAEDMKRNNGFIPGIKPGRKQRNTLTKSCRASHCPALSSWLLWLLCRRLQVYLE